MSRFQKLSLGALISVYIMVAIGAAVRGTGSGMGCTDWPLCNGRIVPPLGDTQAWVEWIHRGWGVLVGFISLAVLIAAVRSHRRQGSIVLASLIGFILVGVQAGLGAITVETGNAGEWVTAHLATAMLLLAVYGFIAVRARYADAAPVEGKSQRLTLLIAFSAISVYALLLFGSHVTATGAWNAYPDWPLFGGSLVPSIDPSDPQASLQLAQFLHRFVSLVVGVIVLVTSVVVWRNARQADESRRAPGAEELLGLVGTAAALFAIEVIVGAMQIFTDLASWAVTLHLAIAAAVWGLLAVATFYAYFEARFARPVTAGGATSGGRSDEAGERVPDPDAVPAGATTISPTVRDRVNAYVALTKPRIIELLLVTTVPAMVLAAVRMENGPDLPHFAWLVAWTLIGGTLAAGAANAINCYLDRDIDQIMVRTRRRPLPAHQVAPEDALAFGLVLSVISFGILALFVNLVAAFLTLLAIGFYVVVYTLLLKRSTPQNIVLGGAAGALPPVIGWAAVTGDITLPALVLFAVVFYWTPPHFWALSLRIRGDYALANVPMLPVVAGVPETTRQIALYTALMVCLTLVFFAVAHMGLIYLGGALLLGGLFLFQAIAMWREGTDRRAVRLYKFSIAYLSALFALVVIDALLFVPLG